MTEKEKELSELLKKREQDIIVLQIQKEDKKNNLLYRLGDRLKIRYKDFNRCRNITELETKAMALEITLEKVFDILEDEGVEF